MESGFPSEEFGRIGKQSHGIEIGNGEQGHFRSELGFKTS